jgi:amidohydrolase
MLVGSAMVLSQIADELPGKVKFVFQPAEEEGGGAQKLCEGGVLADPRVDGMIAQHGWPTLPLGSVALRCGPAMASNDPFSITVRGRGTHGAYPQRGIDPVCVAAYIVTALQSIVARTVSPLDAAVVSVGAIAGGSMLANNIIPDECEMKGTLRHLRPEVGEHLRHRLREIVEYTARAHGATAEVHFRQGYPPVVNDEKMSRLVEQTARDLLGPENINTDESPSMGVEDFAYYAQQVPAVMFRLGLLPKDQEHYPALHNPRFDFNDDALPIGIRMFCELTKRFLTKGT